LKSGVRQIPPRSYGPREQDRKTDASSTLEVRLPEAGVHLVVVPIDLQRKIRVLVDELSARNEAR